MPTLAITSNITDSFIAGGGDYATARSTSSVFQTAGDVNLVGQNPEGGGVFSLFRMYLAFDTSGLPAGATLTQANLTMTVSNDQSDDDFDVLILQQDWSAQDPITDLNREAAFDNCLTSPQDLVIWRNTAGLVVDTPYTSGNLDITWVDTAGITYYSIAGSTDYIAPGAEPVNFERLYVYRSEYAIPAHRPILTLTYTLPPPTPITVTLHTTPAYSCYIDIATPQGVRIAQVDNFLALSYARTVNDYGVMTLDLDPDTDRSLFRLDGRLGMWRQPMGGGLGLEFDTVWLIRNTKRVLKPNGERRLRITAVSALWLLTARIIAYAAGSAQATKTATDADNLLKDFVDENMGASATDTDRHWHDLITIAADESLGTHVDKACARRNLLTVCQEVADQSQQLGYPLYFDVVCPTYGTLEFRTWINQRGADRRASSDNPLILSPELGSISEAEYEENYLDESTYVYAGGKGEEALREIATASDTARIGSSPFGRREYFRDARQGATGDALTAEATAALYARRPRRLFSGSLTDTEQVKYGRDWRWGDRVTVQFEGEAFDCEISAVKVQIADGRETVSAALRAEEII